MRRQLLLPSAPHAVARADTTLTSQNRCADSLTALALHDEKNKINTRARVEETLAPRSLDGARQSHGAGGVGNGRRVPRPHGGAVVQA